MKRLNQELNMNLEIGQSIWECPGCHIKKTYSDYHRPYCYELITKNSNNITDINICNDCGLLSKEIIE